MALVSYDKTPSYYGCTECSILSKCEKCQSLRTAQFTIYSDECCGSHRLNSHISIIFNQEYGVCCATTLAFDLMDFVVDVDVCEQHVEGVVEESTRYIKSLLTPDGTDFSEAIQVRRLKERLFLLAYGLPGIGQEVKYPCDCDERKGEYERLMLVIMHLNDYHGWTRADIADWLDSIDDPFGGGPDLAFKIPEEK